MKSLIFFNDFTLTTTKKNTSIYAGSLPQGSDGFAEYGAPRIYFCAL